ncbi:MAG: O-antigen/teichoic acid export membrane protein [Acidimicrobiales bacterium]
MTAPAASQQGSAAASGLAVAGAITTMVANFGIAWLVSTGGAGLTGVFFVTTAIIAIASNGSCLGTMTGMVYFLPRTLADPQPNPRGLLVTALRPVILVSSAITLLLLVAAPFIADVVAADSAAAASTMLRIMAFAVVPWAVTVTLLGATRGLGSMTPTAGIGQVLRPGLQIVLLAVVFALDRTPPAATVAVAWLIPVMIGLVVAVWSVRRLGGFRTSDTSPVEPREFWSYTRPRAASTALQIALERLDVVIVGALIGTGPAGVYGALTRYVTAGNFLIFSIGQAVSGHLRRAVVAQNWDRAGMLLKQATGWLVLLAWPYFLLVGAQPKPLARLLSADYVGEAHILTILVFGMLFSAAAGPIDLTLLMLGRSAASLAAVAAAIVTDLLLLAVLAKPFGLTGAAIAWAVSVVVQNSIASVLVYRDTGLRAWSSRSTTAALVAVVATVPALFIGGTAFAGLVAAAALAGLIMLAAVALLHRQLGLDELLPQRLLSRLPGF